MRKRISLLIAALMLALTMSFGTMAAFAQQANAPEGCFKERGTIICPQEGKNDKFQQEETKKGSLQSSHEAEEECTARPGQDEKCPPGQFDEGQL